MKHSLVTSAAAAPFAHLLGGLGRKSAARRAEDDKPEEDKDAARAEEDDEKDKDAVRAEEDDEKDKDAVRAEGGDDEDDKDKDGKRGKKAKAEDDDESCAEEDDDDEDVSAAAKSGRRAERARCRKIFSSPAAGQRPDVAAQLAFTTNLPSAEALGILQAAAGGAAPQASRRIDERMSRVSVPAIGADGGDPPRTDAPKGKAAAIVAAMNKARGGK